MWIARDAGVAKLSITSIDLEGASNSKSADSAASQSRAETTAGTQVVAGGRDRHPPGQEAVDQSLVNSDQEETKETMSADSEAATAAAAAAKTAAEAGAGDNDVEIIEPSPTNLDPNKMPKTIGSNIFTRAKNQAYSSWVRISKLLVQGNSKVKELKEVEEERGEEESEDEDANGIHKDLLEDISKIKLQLEEHREFSHEIVFMASYIVECRPGAATETDKIKREAKEAFKKSVKDEEGLEEKISAWRRANKKWLRNKKKDKAKEKVETVKVDNLVGRSRWIENLARDLKPSFHL